MFTSRVWVGLAVGLAAAGPAAAGERWVKLRHVATGQVMGPVGGRPDNDTPLALVNDSDGPDVHWRIDPAGGHLRVVHRASGRALDVHDVSNTAGVHVRIWDAHFGANQQWVAVADGKTAVRLRGVGSGLVIAPTADGRLVPVPATDAEDQLWEVAEVRPPAPPRRPPATAKWVKLRHPATGKVAGLLDGVTESGVHIILVADGDRSDVLWRLEGAGDHFRVVHRKSQKVFDVDNQLTTDGAAVILWPDNGGGNQRWAWDGDGPAKRLVGQQSGRAADVDAHGFLVIRTADPAAESQLWEAVAVDVKARP